MKIGDKYVCTGTRQDNKVIRYLEEIRRTASMKNLQKNITCRSSSIAVWIQKDRWISIIFAEIVL